MTTFISYQTVGGHPWTPHFVESIDLEKCLGCGRCVKVCSQSCLSLISHYDEEADTERFIATIEKRDFCIGCQACGKTCVRNCYSFKPCSI